MSSESTLGREGIELVEFVLPKCANVYGQGPCTASLGVGSECYNTRATCQSPNDYRARADGHLTADLTLIEGEVIDNAAIDRTASFFSGVDVKSPIAPDGVIWELGDGTNGAYLGVTSGNLEFEVLSSGSTGNVTVAASAIAGKSVTLFCEINFVASGGAGTSEINLWSFDPVELEMTLLGTDTFTGGPVWASASDGGVGAVTATTIGGKSTSDWNGPQITARLYSATPAPADMSDNFRSNLFLGRGIKGEPRDEKYILPTLGGVGTIGTKINLSAADDDYEPLGRRATLDFTVADFTHSDIGQDPYYATRAVDPRTRSTFWRKWLIRQKFGKVGARVRVYDGYAGQALADYNRRGYVLEDVKVNENSLSFYCRDELARTELLKAQTPVATAGALSADVTIGATSFTVSGDFTDVYPAAGTVRINDEIITYTGIAYASPLTTFSGLTRGTDGSTADAHDTDDQVQLCRRISGTVEQVITELLTVDAGIEGQLVDLSGLASEQALYLSAYTLTGLISEVTSVNRVLGWISQETGVYIWWDERQQQIRVKAIRAVAASDITRTFTHESNIVESSFRFAEKPRQRLNSVTLYYNPKDFAGELDDVTNFANSQKIVNGTNSSLDQYGNVLQAKSIFSRFLTTNAEIAQTGARLANRYEDVPIEAQFLVDAKDRAAWTGDVINVSTPVIVDANGDRAIRRWLIIEAEEIDRGHLVQYSVADITLDGLIYTITIDGLGSYTPALFAAGNLFITDDNGLNPDGTTGARIS